MSNSHIPHPAPYRRPAQSENYDLPQQDGQAQLAPEAATGLTETETLLRQRLAPELEQRLAPEFALQQWHHQQQMSESAPQQYHPTQQASLHQQAMAPPPHIPLQRNPQVVALTAPVQTRYTTPSQPLSTQSPSEAPGHKPAVKTTRTKVKQPVRRRKSGSVAASKEDSDGSISEEFTMEGVKTKSGRKVHRPAQFNPAQKTPSRRRGPYRRNYDARICKACQRGHSPQSNMIVFCDGCNTPYHQLCHDPPIEDLVVAVESAEWFCAGCAKSREQRPLVMGLIGATLTEEERRLYLASLPVSSLMELIFFAEKTHPDLPLYDPETKKLVAALKNANTTRVDDVIPTASYDPEDTGGPNWEDMIVRAITTLDTGRGVQPKNIFEWLSTNFPALEGRDVRSEAQGSLQAVLRKERLLREGHAYRINPAFVSSPITSEPQLKPGLLAPGAGIKLPLETEEEGAKSMLIDDDLVAFSHQFSDVAAGMGTEGQTTVEDMMEGIVQNGFQSAPISTK